MQSITATSGPLATSPSSAVATVGMSLTTSATGPAPTEWITNDREYSVYLTMGMNPAAASYAVENGWYATDENGRNPQAIVEYDILSNIQSRLPPGYLHGINELNRLSVIQYFISDAPASYQAYESSFISVWNSYQSITPDASVSSWLHSIVEPTPKTSSIDNSGARNSARPAELSIGIVAAMLYAIAELM